VPEIELARETTTFAEAFVHMGVTNPWFYRMLIGRLYYAAHHLGRRLLAEAGLKPENWRGSGWFRGRASAWERTASPGERRWNGA